MANTMAENGLYTALRKRQFSINYPVYSHRKIMKLNPSKNI